MKELTTMIIGTLSSSVLFSAQEAGYIDEKEDLILLSSNPRIIGADSPSVLTIQSVVEVLNQLTLPGCITDYMVATDIEPGAEYLVALAAILRIYRSSNYSDSEIKALADYKEAEVSHRKTSPKAYTDLSRGMKHMVYQGVDFSEFRANLKHPLNPDFVDKWHNEILKITAWVKADYLARLNKVTNV